jgi:putative transcriptional regulator
LKTVIIKSRTKELRARYDLTQDQLADLVDARRETIVHIEHNRYNPSLILAYKISRALKSNIEDVFTFEEKAVDQEKGN